MEIEAAKSFSAFNYDDVIEHSNSSTDIAGILWIGDIFPRDYRVPPPGESPSTYSPFGDSPSPSLANCGYSNSSVSPEEPVPTVPVSLLALLEVLKKRLLDHFSPHELFPLMEVCRLTRWIVKEYLLTTVIKDCYLTVFTEIVRSSESDVTRDEHYRHLYPAVDRLVTAFPQDRLIFLPKDDERHTMPGYRKGKFIPTEMLIHLPSDEIADRWFTTRNEASSSISNFIAFRGPLHKGDVAVYYKIWNSPENMTLHAVSIDLGYLMRLIGRRDARNV